MKYIVDSNVFAKLVLNEDFSDIASKLIFQIISNEGRILVPDIFLYELVGIFKKHKLDINIINDFIALHEKEYLEIIALDSKLIAQALEITTKGHEKSGYPSFYDSVYHALAIQNECDFITADNPHFTKTKHLGNIKLLSEIKL